MKFWDIYNDKNQTSFKIFNFLNFIFRERGREGGWKRGKETSMCGCLSRPLLGTWPATQACALTELTRELFGSQPGTQSTEPHQPEQSDGTLDQHIINRKKTTVFL